LAVCRVRLAVGVIQPPACCTAAVHFICAADLDESSLGPCRRQVTSPRFRALVGPACNAVISGSGPAAAAQYDRPTLTAEPFGRQSGSYPLSRSGPDCLYIAGSRVVIVGNIRDSDDSATEHAVLEPTLEAFAGEPNRAIECPPRTSGVRRPSPCARRASPRFILRVGPSCRTASPGSQRPSSIQTNQSRSHAL
jgi:hypothetical protein